MTSTDLRIAMRQLRHLRLNEPSLARLLGVRSRSIAPGGAARGRRGCGPLADRPV